MYMFIRRAEAGTVDKAGRDLRARARSCAFVRVPRPACARACECAGRDLRVRACVCARVRAGTCVCARARARGGRAGT